MPLLTVDHRPVTLRCRVFNVPKPQVKWVHNGLELTGERFQVKDNGNLTPDLTPVSMFEYYLFLN